MDPSFDLPSEEQLLEVLADATPEEQAKLLALLQQLPHLPQVVQALRRETVFKATLYRQISFAVAVLLVLSLFGKKRDSEMANAENPSTQTGGDNIIIII